MQTEIVKLGVVGVDSGQLIICDPADIDGEFKRVDSAGYYGTAPHIPEGEFSYRGICKITSENKKHGGQLNYTLGHEGVAVAFQSGFGDGLYDVFAEIVDTGSWGKRVKKVWVELITDEELSEM
jgi:hypothetical protein